MTARDSRKKRQRPRQTSSGPKAGKRWQLMADNGRVAGDRAPRRMPGSVRSRFGPSAPKTLARMAPDSVLRGARQRGLGIGSVGRGGSVATSKTRSLASAFLHRGGLSELLRIRVSMVRLTRIGVCRSSPFGQLRCPDSLRESVRPWPPLPTRRFETGSGYHPRTIRGH